MRRNLLRILLIALCLSPWALVSGLQKLPSWLPPTKLIEAVQLNRVEEVQALVAQGVDVNEKATYGRTALEAAASRGNVRLSKILIDAGANVNARGDNGYFVLMSTILHYAFAPAGSRELVELLVAHGADVHARNMEGRTALHFAPRDAEVVRVLLKAGADVNATDCAGNTPIGLAINTNITQPPSGNLEVIRQLLEAGARPPAFVAERIRILAANDTRVLALLDRATIAVPTKYGGPCRDTARSWPSEETRVRKAWGDRHYLPLPYGVWDVLSSGGFLVLLYFSPPFLLVLSAMATKDRVLGWCAGGAFLRIVLEFIWFLDS